MHAMERVMNKSIQDRTQNETTGRTRWISRDPLSGAEFLQGPNLYLYAQNNPINRTDYIPYFAWDRCTCDSGDICHGINAL